MIKEHISSAEAEFKKNISRVQQAELEQQLETTPDNRLEAVMSVKTKSLKLTVVLSALFGLFGAGSFYLGLFKRGICKIIFNVILPLTIGLMMLYWFAPLHKEYSIQSKDIYNAVIANEEYNYTYKNLKEISDNYNKDYKSFNTYIDDIDKQSKNIVTVRDYLSDENEEFEVIQSRYDSFVKQLTAFISNSSLNKLLEEINNSLTILEGFTEEEKYEEFYQLTDTVNQIFSAQKFLSNTVSLPDYAELLDELNGKTVNLIKAKNFDAIDTTLKELSSCLQESNEAYNVLHENVYFATEIGLSDLKNQINSLNELVFNIQKEQGVNAVETAADTGLGIAITQFGEDYKSFFETVIAELEENETVNEINCKDFINDLNTKIVSAQSSFEQIKTIIDAIEETELINEMKLQKDKFFEKNKDYFEYLNSDYVNNLKVINKQLPEAKKNAVDNKLSFSKTLSEICLSFSIIKSDTNIDILQNNIEGVTNKVSVLQSRSDQAYWNYRFDYKFANGFFATLLIIDGIIITVYWIFEIFRNREKCQNANYERIVQALK